MSCYGYYYCLGNTSFCLQVFNEFVEDNDLFRRGAENFIVFHQRKLGRLLPSTSASARSKAAVATPAEKKSKHASVRLLHSTP